MKYDLCTDGNIIGQISIPIYMRLTRNLITRIENKETKKYNSNPNNQKTIHVFLKKDGYFIKAQKPEIFDEIYAEYKEDFLFASKKPEFSGLEDEAFIQAVADFLKWEFEDVRWFNRTINYKEEDE